MFTDPDGFRRRDHLLLVFQEFLSLSRASTQTPLPVKFPLPGKKTCRCLGSKRHVWLTSVSFLRFQKSSFHNFETASRYSAGFCQTNKQETDNNSLTDNYFHAFLSAVCETKFNLSVNKYYAAFHLKLEFNYSLSLSLIRICRIILCTQTQALITQL